MQLEYAKDPVWANVEHTMIDLKIKWDFLREELPFTASPTDVEAHGRSLFEAAKNGQFGEVAKYVPPVVIVHNEVIDDVVLDNALKEQE
jgi:hypothetical protein